jgi:serine/threonine protein kinase
MVDFGPDVIDLLRSVLLDHGYIMGDQLGRGGYSVVFKVHLVRFEQDFAAKVTNTASLRHRTADTATTNEDRALVRLNHPNIIRLYQTFYYQNYSFLILELCPGKSLKRRIEEMKGSSLPNVYQLMTTILDAFNFMHSNHYLHRDIKPSNILFDSSGHPKVADFGMCIPAPEGEFMTDFPGSPHYCSPEILMHRPYDPYKADVWALGVTFLEMVAGPTKPPQGCASLAEYVIDHGLLVPPETPDQFAELVRAMTDFKPERRPSLAEVRKNPLFGPAVKDRRMFHERLARGQSQEVSSSFVIGKQKVAVRGVRSRTSDA